MSGNRPGGQPKLAIKKKTLAYPADPANPGHQKIEKTSSVEANTPKPRNPIQLKIGLRIKQNQSIELFEVRFGQGANEFLPLHEQPANSPIAQDLETTLGKALDERWATYLADYDPAFGLKFTSKLRVKPFDVHDNGFQLVTVAFTHANHTFANDNYVFGISLLPGKSNAGIQLNLGGGSPPAPPKKAKPAKKPAKARKSKSAARRKR